MVTPLECYQTDMDRRAIAADPAQARAVQCLHDLYGQVLQAPAAPSYWARWLGRRSPAPRGLYLWGGVGRGKTYLMDCFYRCLPFAAKQRVHFHEFMREIHAQLRELPKTPDPLPIVAASIARRARVLCLDEFQVHDIADAMLLGGLLQALFARRLILVATSNTPIDRLYENGLQRDAFLYAIELLNQHMEEVHLDGGVDYRKTELHLECNFFAVDPAHGASVLQERFRALAGAVSPAPQLLQINKRAIHALGVAPQVVWFDFDALCRTYRSAQDYLEIARRFPTVMISDIARMGEEDDDAANRFIHLIDALYDQRVELVATAAGAPEALYTGRRMAFAFQRTVSRLHEMGSRKYQQSSGRGRAEPAQGPLS